MKQLIAAIFMLTCLMSTYASANKTQKNKSKAPEWPKDKGTYALLATNKGNVVIKLQPDLAPKTVKNFTELAEGKKEYKDAKTGKKSTKPFYDGLTFHRVIPDFMIQGGCPLGNGSGGPGYSFEDECYEKTTETIDTINDDATAQMIHSEIILPYLRSTRNPNPKLRKLAMDCMTQRSGKPLYGQKVDNILKMAGKKGPLYKRKLKAPVAYGTLCMANSGANTNGSQFFIVTKKDGCQWLNGRHTVFGKVVKGMNVVHDIENVDRDNTSNKPVNDVIIKKITIHTVK